MGAVLAPALAIFLAHHAAGARGRDILLLLDASALMPIADAMHAEHAVYMIARNFTRAGDVISLHVGRDGGVFDTPADESVIGASCAALRAAGGAAPSLYEFVVRAIDTFSLHREQQQIAARDPVVFLISNGQFLESLDSETKALLQTLHERWGCETSVMITTRGDPTQRASMFLVAAAGGGKVYVTKKGHGPYEVVDVEMGRGGLTVRGHRVVAPSWLPNVL